MRSSTKIFAVAIGAEIILVSTGLSLAGVQSWAAFANHGSVTLAASAAAFPVLLAVLELFKIPAGSTLYTARWLMKPFAALLLLGGTVATFETVTMAGSTWFRALQFEITTAQSELNALRERRDGTGDQTSQVDEITAAMEALDRQIEMTTNTPDVSATEASLDALTTEIEALLARRDAARKVFADEWDAQTDNNTERIASDNAQIAEQGLASQRSMPTRQVYVDARMADWEASEGQLVSARIAELQAKYDVARQALDTARTEAATTAAAAREDLRTERSRLQEDLMRALEADRMARTESVELSAAIEAQQRNVARLAGESVVYDIAAKVYGVALHEISEEQANVTTFWVVLGVGLAAALSTGLAAFMAAYLDAQKRTVGHLRAVRMVEAKSRAMAESNRVIAALRQDLEAEKRKPPKVEYRDRVVYRYLPIDRDLTVNETRGQFGAVKAAMSDAA